MGVFFDLPILSIPTILSKQPVPIGHWIHHTLDPPDEKVSSTANFTIGTVYLDCRYRRDPTPVRVARLTSLRIIRP